MRLFQLAVLVLSSCLATAGAQSLNLTAFLAIPECGQNCIQTLAAQSTCGLQNITCICTNVPLNNQIAGCLKTDCTVIEQLEVEKYSKDTCGVKPRDRTLLIRTIGVTFGIIGLIAYGLRVWERANAGWTTLWWDDLFITIAVVFMIPFSVLSVPLSNYGLGKDIWNLKPYQITGILYIYFWDELIYIGVLPITKVSILFLYLRIFPKKSFKRAAYILMGFNAAYFIAFELVSIFQCRPVQGAWLKWDGTFKATCNDVNMQGWTSAAFNIALDIATIALPFTELVHLQMTLRKKMQIMAMFGVGAFVTVVSIVRLSSLATYASTANITQDYVDIGYWSTIEVPVGILCACMPAMRSLFARILPRVFGSTNREKSKYANASGGSELSRSGYIRTPGIKVQEEWRVESSHRTNESAVELNPIESPGRSARALSISGGREPEKPRESV